MGYDINKNKTETHVQGNDNTTFNDDELPVPAFSVTTSSFIVAMISVACFWTSQYGSFVFDDNSAILSNEDIQSHTPLSNIFEHDFWGTHIRSNLSHKSYRPVTVLTYRLNYILAGGYKPWGFRFVNIVLHAIHSVFLLRVYSILLGGIKVDGNNRRIYTAPKASLLCAILFAIHPIHTESVAAVVGRADLICGIFCAVSFLCYSKHCHLSSHFHVSLFSIHIGASILCAALATFAKEQGITVLGLCVAYDTIMVVKVNFKSLASLVNGQDGKIVSVMKRVSIMVAAAVFLLIFRLSIMGSGPTFQYQDNPASFQESSLMRILNYHYLYSINLWLLLNPWWLCFDWSMGCVPVITSLTDIRLFAPLFMLLLFICVVLKVLTILDTHVGRCLAMSIAFLAIPFLPAMNIFFRVGFVVAERNLYISSIGFIMMVVIGATVLCSNSIGRQITKIGLAMLIVFFTIRTIHRTNVWLSEITLFTSGLTVCPLNAKVHYNVGKCSQDAGDADQAIVSYLEAIRLLPTYDQPMNNLGNIYKEKNMLKEAEYYHAMSVDVTPKFATGWMNLGTVKADLKKKKEAIDCFTQAVKLRRKYPDAYYNWGNLHLEFKEYDVAMSKYNMAIELKPDHVQAWQNKIMLMGQLDQAEELLKIGKKISTLFPTDSNIFYIYGNAVGKAGKLKESIPFLKKSIQLQPSNSQAHGNLGVVFHRLERYEEAEKCYLESMRLNPDNKFSHDNYKKLQRVLKKVR